MEDVPQSDEWLAAGEVACLAGLRIPKRRRDWRLGRWTAKQAVAAYLGLDAGLHRLAEIEIRAASSGAPEALLRGSPAPVSLSISHRKDTGMCATGPPGVAIGCDLEVVEVRAAAFLEDFFTDGEQKLVEATPPPDRTSLITMLWSAKESVLKALGVGLRAPTTSVSVIPVEAGQLVAWGRFQAVDSASQRFDGWWRESVGLVRTIAAGAVQA